MFTKIYLLIFTILVIDLRVKCDFIAPPKMSLERNWQIPESTPVGNRIIQVHAFSEDDKNLTFGLEPSGYNSAPENLPFRIDPHTGIVYLNQSLEGQAGKNILLYVTLSNGEITTKTEVLVKILKSLSHHINNIQHSVPSINGEKEIIEEKDIEEGKEILSTHLIILLYLVAGSLPIFIVAYLFRKKIYSKKMRESWESLF